MMTKWTIICICFWSVVFSIKIIREIMHTEEEWALISKGKKWLIPYLSELNNLKEFLADYLHEVSEYSTSDSDKLISMYEYEYDNTQNRCELKKHYKELCLFKNLYGLFKLCVSYDVPEYSVQNIFGSTLPSYMHVLNELRELRTANELVPAAIKNHEKAYSKCLKAFMKEVELKKKEVEQIIANREIVSKSDFKFAAASEEFKCSCEHDHPELNYEITPDTADKNQMQAAV